MPGSETGKTPTFVNFLRIWLSFVAVMAIGNTVQCFISPYLFGRLYTVDEKNVSDLAARLFGIWTLLAGGLRLMCALDVYNKMLYHVTLFSFVLACGHFLSEVLVYGTATFTATIVAPVIVSSVSTILMAVGYFVIDPEDPRTLCVDENAEILKSRPKKIR
ncbi:unnamed protein product [Candidula unifasciata]|uniref:Ergosterol biosynthetic protein 28 n=1 Tax=Candidula unifasciata TaxID=100452 RepID=A0A8S3YLX3_9EUPU|nr:unnamed protein product [Candidula unifasciata]